MFGGADPKIANLVPADIEFRRNDCSKPLSWKEGIMAKPIDINSSALNLFGSNLSAGRDLLLPYNEPRPSRLLYDGHVACI